MKKWIFSVIACCIFSSCSSAPFIIPTGGADSVPHVFLRKAVHKAFSQGPATQIIDHGCTYEIVNKLYLADDVSNRVNKRKNELISYINELCKNNTSGELYKIGSGEYSCMDRNKKSIYYIKENVSISSIREKIAGYYMNEVTAKYYLTYPASKDFFYETNNKLKEIDSVIKVVDNSGMYAGEDIVDVSKIILTNTDCESGIDDIKVKYRYNIKNKKYFYNLSPYEEEFYLNDNEYRPYVEVRILGRWATRVFIDESFDDGNITISNLDFDKNTDIVKLKVSNNTDRYVEIITSSFFYNNTYLNIKELAGMKMPPFSNKILSLRVHSFVGYKSDADFWAFDRARLTTPSTIGFSAEYSTGGEIMNFYELKNIIFDDKVTFI